MPNIKASTIKTQALPESSAFASRMMLNILRSGLSTLGLNMIADDTKEVSARIPLTTKQNWVNDVAKLYDITTLLRLGVGVSDFIGTPIGRALLTNSSEHTLIKKWQRLERYIHSQHFITAEFTSHYVKVSHCSNTEHQPTVEEDFAVLGVLCALLQHVSGQPVLLCTSENKCSCVFELPSNVIRAPFKAKSYAQMSAQRNWYIHFETNVSAKQSDMAEGKGQFIDDLRIMSPAHMTESNSAILANLAQVIMSLGLLDIDLPKVAHSLALSVRTLQRRLGQLNMKFSSIVQEVRVKHAGILLLEGQLGISEIGFICGFSDQAHFSRVFKMWTGLSPKQYGEFKKQKSSQPSFRTKGVS
ncbi:helix-turn-helix transcriptional regulator [Pseudoalteromonas citrea]|uniref:helix-turn-helix transcriptional regulator n=1 Tax=Pseudoalteromonas citrea TaxID=43655 RepID=UPI0014875D2D|nr:AraC family transcriptional regulator [Pseudoalteromonas citrea]